MKTIFSVLLSVAKGAYVFGSGFATAIALFIAYELLVNGGVTIGYRILFGILLAATIALQVAEDRAKRTKKTEVLPSGTET